MNFPLYFLLLPYILFLFFFVVMCAFSFYHVIRFGFINASTISVTVIFIIASITILSASAFFLKDVNWQDNITVNLDSNSIQLETTDEAALETVTF